MEKRDFFSSIFWFCLAVYIVIESSRLGLGGWRIPGPGYFSFGGAILLGMMSLVVLVKSLRKATRQNIPVRSGEKLRWQNVILVLAAMFLYAFLLDRIGFALCTFFLILIFLRGVAHEGWVKTITVAFLVTLGAYLLFNVFLNTQLPKGMFYF